MIRYTIIFILLTYLITSLVMPVRIAITQTPEGYVSAYKVDKHVIDVPNKVAILEITIWDLYEQTLYVYFPPK